MEVKAYSVDAETIKAIEAHAKRNRASLSWALRDLVRRGFREDLPEIQRAEEEWKIR